ncbi:DUF4232 domain-containing protein [Streptomyces sp. NPDC055607]
MRTHRIRIAAAATFTAAALSLTACQGAGGGTRDEGRASSATTTAPTTPAPTGTPAPTVTPSEAPTGPDASGNESTSPQGSADAPTVPTTSAAPGKNGENGGKSTAGTVDRPCDASAVRVVYSPVSRPLNHALLTVTNTGRTACNAYYAPVLRLDDGQAAVAVDQDSKPQAVVTLFPGESAYAAMILSAADGSGQHGRTSKKLTVWFAPRDNVGSAGGPAVLKLPAGTYTDSTTRVTYWQTSMEHALGF